MKDEVVTNTPSNNDNDEDNGDYTEDHDADSDTLAIYSLQDEFLIIELVEAENKGVDADN